MAAARAATHYVTTCLEKVVATNAARHFPSKVLSDRDDQRTSFLEGFESLGHADGPPLRKAGGHACVVPVHERRTRGSIAGRLVPPQKNQCSFRVSNSLTDNAMEPAISRLTVAGLASASRTMCTELQRAEQEVVCRCRLPTSTASQYRSRIPVGSRLSVLPRNIPSCAGTPMVSMF